MRTLNDLIVGYGTRGDTEREAVNHLNTAVRELQVADGQWTNTWQTVSERLNKLERAVFTQMSSPTEDTLVPEPRYTLPYLRKAYSRWARKLDSSGLLAEFWEWLESGDKEVS